MEYEAAIFRYAKSKRCGYVQFKTEHEAQLAVNYFDYSLMDTCTIFYQIALKKDDEKKKKKKKKKSKKDAIEALEDTEGSSFQGRVLHVEPAKQRYQSDAPETINASKTLKQKRNAERK
ncbi:hypothetical protein CASFOL_011726 [Castilleja foliolosa]|uniref:RRM domain-containing protein n=1 Tax=Castilleja foliolosa TaxID=1961234 RepID=A0ABD3DQ55_9LAMI